MTLYSADLDIAEALHAPDHCPVCAAHGMEAVSDGENTNFRCPSCGRCWHVELGQANRVEPTGCVRCEYRPQCLLDGEGEGCRLV